jgi:hypothetical protein
MSALECPNVLVLQALHIGGSREQHEIVRLQPARVIGARERLVGVPPRVFRVRGAAALERPSGRPSVDAHGPSFCGIWESEAVALALRQFPRSSSTGVRWRGR